MENLYVVGATTRVLLDQIKWDLLVPSLQRSPFFIYFPHLVKLTLGLFECLYHFHKTRPIFVSLVNLKSPCSNTETTGSSFHIGGPGGSLS